MRGADVNMRQMGSELKMLAAGLVLGRLVLRKPSAPAPVVVRITEPASKPKRKRDFFTNNAVVAGVVSAVVAGVISYLVAHQQSQDADRQAQQAQQVQEAGQLESAANALYLAATNVYNFQTKCASAGETWNDCAGLAPGFKSYSATSAAFAPASFNVKDEKASILATEMTHTASVMIYVVTSAAAAQTQWNTMVNQYVALESRCAQIIQGQN